MRDDEPRRRVDARLDDHRGDLDAFNADAASKTGIIDGWSTFRSADRFGELLTDLGGSIARGLRTLRVRASRR
jgi:hypothetical protein